MIIGRKNANSERGDTLVEVLLATVVLSVVLAGAYTLSNRATRLNQQAFERTQVSALLQEQAELVRAARDSYIPSNPSAPESVIWSSLTSPAYAQSAVAPLGNDCDSLSTLGASARMVQAFHIDQSPSVQSGMLPGQSLYRIWAEIEGAGASPRFWDVHVFGCWEGVGNNPTNITSIVLRLEDPG